MSLSKNVVHCRKCVKIPKRQFQTDNFKIQNTNSQMSIKSMSSNQWRVVNQLREYLAKFTTDVASGKDMMTILQKIKPNLYGSEVLRHFESTTAVTVKPPQKPEKSQSSKNQPSVVKENLPEHQDRDDGNLFMNILTGLGFGGTIIETKDATQELLPKWRIKTETAVSPSSVSSRTRHVISQIATAEMESSLLNRIETLTSHLKHFPEAKNEAIKEGAIRLLLRVRDNVENPQVLGAVQEAFARLGHVDPPTGRGIRILSIDGGGIRGVVVIEMLRKLEQLTGLRVHEMFDYVCGVSTGAILTGAIIANKRTLDNTSQYYKELSTQIFKQNALMGTSNLVLKQSYYDTSLWEKLLREYLGELSMIETARDSKCPKFSVVSAVVNQSQLSAFVFRNYSLPYRVQSQYIGSSEYAMWQAIRASAAAPTYFEEFMLDGLLHQDGGIMVNNPTAIAIHEAKQLWPNTPIQCVISFGTGRVHSMSAINSIPDKATSNSSWKTKFLRIIDSATDTEGVHTILNDLLDPDVYYRFNPYLTEFLSMTEIRAEKMVQLEQDALMYLRRNEDKFEQAAKKIKEPRQISQKVHDWADKQCLILGLK